MNSIAKSIVKIRINVAVIHRRHTVSLIQNVMQFHKVLNVAIEKAQEPDALVTIGIAPTHPETGYGYIQFNGTIEMDEEPAAFSVKTFAEKPDLPTAESFLDSGDFLWNSGIFVWTAEALLTAMQAGSPDLADCTREMIDASKRVDVEK